MFARLHTRLFPLRSDQGSRARPFGRWLVFLLAPLLFGLAMTGPTLGQEDPNQKIGPSGLPLPRFVSTRSEPINVRVGPGTRYAIAWVFKKAGLPVEIIQEFDVWRKIRYVDGSEGWIHQNLLSGKRTALTRPFNPGGRTGLYAAPKDNATVRAWLAPDYLVDVDHCADGWCEVTTKRSKAHGPITGYVVQFELWGVYPDEKID